MPGTAVQDTFIEMQQVVIEHGPIRFKLWESESGEKSAPGIARAFGLTHSERSMLRAYEVLKQTHTINVHERELDGGWVDVTISAA